MLGRSSPDPEKKKQLTIDPQKAYRGGVVTYWYDDGTIIPFAYVVVAYPQARAYEEEEPTLTVQLHTGFEFEVIGEEKITEFLEAYLNYLAVQGRNLSAQSRQKE